MTPNGRTEELEPIHGTEIAAFVRMYETQGCSVQRLTTLHIWTFWLINDLRDCADANHWVR